MNKQFIYLLFFYFFSQNVIAQNSWIKNFGSLKSDNLDMVKTDDSNNVYVAGRFGGSMTIGDTTILKPGSNTYNYFIAKFNENGTFKWVASFVNAGYNETVSALAIDKRGNVYMAIQYNGMLLKYDVNGQLLIQKSPTAWYTRYSNIEIDSNNNIWIGGSFSQYNFSFDGLPAMPHNGGTSLYIAKLDSNLIAKMVIPIGCNSLSSRVGRIALKDSLIYIIGNTDNDVYIGTDTFKNAKILTACFNTKGTYKWARAVNPIGITSSENIWDIAVSDSQQIVITGLFYDPIKIGNITLSNTNNKENFFIASYDINGNLLWAKKSTTIYSSGNGVEFTPNGKIALVVDYNFSFSLGSISVGDGVSNKRYASIVSLDKNGNTEWIKSLGQKDWTYGVDLTIDKKGNWYMGGTFQSTTTNEIDGHVVTSVGDIDIYLLKNFSIAQPTIGNIVFCNDGSPKTIAATGTNIRWYSDSLLTNLVFAGNNLLLNIYSDTTFYVTQTVGSSISNPKKINVLVNALTKVNILKNGNILSVNPAVGKTYSWFKDGQFLSGQNSATYTPTVIGKYHALMIDKNNCYNYTDTFNYVPNSVFENSKISLNIYPNPCKEKLQFNSSDFIVSEVKVYNQIGNLIFKIKGKNLEEISTLNFADGLYIIQLISENKTFNQSFEVRH